MAHVLRNYGWPFRVQRSLSFDTPCVIHSDELYTGTAESTLGEGVTNAETTASYEDRTSEDGSTLKTYSDTAVPGDIQTSTQMDGFGSEGIAMTGNDFIMMQIGNPVHNLIQSV